MSPVIMVQVSEGRRVRHPGTLQILEPGKKYRVLQGQFWMRRLACGDVFEIPDNQENSVILKKKKEKAEENKA